MSEDSKQTMDRRQFIGATTAAGLGLMFMRPELVRGTQANSEVRLGLLGCGGRGLADATSMVSSGPARVVALADMFDDQLQAAKKRLDKQAEPKGRPEIDAALMFRGPKAFQQICASKEVDAVVIATPPYYHPEHFEAAVAAGKHVYLEKPVAVDVRGAKRVMRAGKKAEGRQSVDVGFQIRNAPPFVEMVRRIHEGALGKIACGQAFYYAGGLNRPDWPNASPAERRLRNWVRDRVLSGDILVEQGIHVVDICNWVLKSHPAKASGGGGRNVRTDPGDAWDHYNVTFFYPENVHVSFTSTQFIKGWFDVCERFFGTKGTSESHYEGGVNIKGDEPWDAFPNAAESRGAGFSATGSFTGALKDADPEKHKAFLASITSGRFHNQAEQGAESALSAILGRTAAETGREVTWEALLKSDRAWDAKLDLSKL
jgi:myo-inositol 2-dehydrogenase/D-chiro-inositol 1-dehydrogenase